MATTNINIPSLNVVQTTAEWALDFTVYSDKFVLWVSDVFYASTDQMQFKKADGVQTFANLDFMPIGAGGSDSVFIEFSHTVGTSLADGQDYFIAVGTSMGNTVNSSVPEPTPTATVTEAYISTYNAGTFGSTEDLTIDLVDETGALLGAISSGVKFDLRNRFYKETLNIAVTEGRTFIKLNVPGMVTNPSSAKLCVNLKYEL